MIHIIFKNIELLQITRESKFIFYITTIKLNEATHHIPTIKNR